MSRIGLLRGAAKFTPDADGHTATPGDYGLDLPTAGGYVSVAAADFLNAATTNDELSLAYWIKNYDITNSSAFWIASPSQQRVFQAHVPWGNNTIYFDTSGCCAADTQRLQGRISEFPAYTGEIDWWTNNWHLFVFSKKAGVKQVWIDGLLFLQNDGGATPLSTDINSFNIGADFAGTGRMHGVVDDFTVWSTALTEAQIINLFGGALPTALPASAGLMAWWNFNDPPSPPPCEITGPAPVCPSSANSYSAPSGAAAYNWSISGNGSIVGSTTNSSVAVAAGALCNASFTLVVTVTGTNGLQSLCTNSFSVIDTTPPVIACPGNIAVNADAGQCSKSNVTYVVTATDNCSGDNTVLCNPPSASTFPVGMTMVTCTATDPCGNATNCTFTVTVVDTLPTISSISDQITAEDTATSAIGFTIGDAETPVGALTLSKASSNPTLVPPNNIVFGGIGANRTVAITPATDQNGSATITIIVTDACGLSASNTFLLVATAVNDPPSFIKGPNQTVNHGVGAQTVNNWATAISAGPADEAGQTLTFLVSNDNNGLFAAQPAVSSSGTLTYRPEPGANGSATVAVRLQDNGGTANGGMDTSGPQTFTITILPPLVGPIRFTSWSFNTGQFQLQFIGQPGGNFTLQASALLTTNSSPMNWTNLLTTNSSSGSVSYTDTNALSISRRYYRILQQ